jgi:hypothetical protein
LHLTSKQSTGALDFSCPKLTPGQRDEALILAGCHRLGQLRSCLSRRLVAWHHRAGCRRVLVRGCGYRSEKCTARFFKRIFRFCTVLFHLGLLISSSFVLLSASSPAIQLFVLRTATGWHRGPRTKLFPIPSSGIPLVEIAQVRRNHLKRFHR